MVLMSSEWNSWYRPHSAVALCSNTRASKNIPSLCHASYRHLGDRLLLHYAALAQSAVCTSRALQVGGWSWCHSCSCTLASGDHPSLSGDFTAGKAPWRLVNGHAMSPWELLRSPPSSSKHHQCWGHSVELPVAPGGKVYFPNSVDQYSGRCACPGSVACDSRSHCQQEILESASALRCLRPTVWTMSNQISALL